MTSKLRASRRWVLAAIAITMGVGFFVYGQALGALLFSICPDFKSPGLSLRCRQPVLYIWFGIAMTLVGAVGLLALLGQHLLRRRSRPRSG